MNPVHQHRFAILYSLLSVLIVLAVFATVKVATLKDSTHVIVKTNLGETVEGVGFDYLVTLGASQGLKVSSYGILKEKVKGSHATITYKLKTDHGDINVEVTFLRTIWTPINAQAVK